jgi:hypothetical protein
VAATRKNPSVAKGKEGRVHQTFTARHSSGDKEELKNKKT